MAGVTAQGGVFTYAASSGISVTAKVTGLSVETPQSVLADMTPINAAARTMLLIPTGERSGGSITVDYIHADGGIDPQALAGSYGTLSFSSAGYSVSRAVVLESAETLARTGDIVRGTLKFRMTDYNPSGGAEE